MPAASPASATGTSAVTVVAADLVTADVYATAAVAMGPDRATGWLAGMPGVRALIVREFGALQLVLMLGTVLITICVVYGGDSASA